MSFSSKVSIFFFYLTKTNSSAIMNNYLFKFGTGICFYSIIVASHSVHRQTIVDLFLVFVIFNVSNKRIERTIKNED